MLRTCRLVLSLCLAYSSVFCEYQSDGSVSSVFGSLRRTDHSDEKTYHFSKMDRFTPIKEPIIYADGYNDDSKMVVGFQNMLIFGIFESQKHYVIRVNEGSDQDAENIPSEFLTGNDSGELFDIVTLKPTSTTTPTPQTTRTATTLRTTSTTQFPRFLYSYKEMQREALPGFDPDTQSLDDYLHQVLNNMTNMYHQ